MVVTLFNVSELNRIKDSGSGTIKRERAKKALAWIESTFPQGASEKTRINDIAFSLCTTSGDPHRYKLDGTIKDNILIAILLDKKEQGEKVSFFSHDTGARLLAKTYGIPCIDPTAYLLSEEPDSQAIELRKCKQELEQYKNRIPKLSIVCNQTKSTEVPFAIFTLDIPIEEKKIFAEYTDPRTILNHVSQTIGGRTYNIPIPQLGGINTISASEYDRWVVESKKYNEDYDAYKKHIELINEISFAKTSLIVNNTGTSKASHIRVRIYFPQGITVFDDKEFTKIKDIKAPFPPEEPHCQFDMLKGINYSSLMRSMTSIDSHVPYPINYCLEKKDEHYEFEYHETYLLHDNVFELPTLFFISPPIGFMAQYKISAEELLHPITGELQFHFIPDEGNKTIS